MSGSSFGGSQDRVASKRVDLANVTGPQNRNESTKKGTTVPISQNEGAKNGTTVPKKRTRVHSPNRPFYKTGLLSPRKLADTISE